MAAMAVASADWERSLPRIAAKYIYPTVEGLIVPAARSVAESGHGGWVVGWWLPCRVVKIKLMSWEALASRWMMMITHFCGWLFGCDGGGRPRGLAAMAPDRKTQPRRDDDVV